MKNGGRILYCDTDSFYVAFRRDVSDETHGLLKWDSKEKNLKIEKACFATSKAYSVVYENKMETRIKGVPANSISFEEFEKSFYASSDFKINSPFFSKKNFIISIKEINKKISINSYDKRKFVDASKKYTIPLDLKKGEGV